MFENVLKLTDSFLEMGIPGYDLAIWQNGKCLLRHQGGYRDIEKTQPMDGTEKYDIYSCSKMLTCTAALQLWEQGKFQLEDKLSDYMPEFTEMTVKTEDGIVPAKNPIRIHHLFEMTAGFNYDTSSPAVMACREATDGRCPTREFMRYLAKEPLMFEPGDQYLYSLCHDVLAALVEVVSGQKFEDYVQKHIFEPVGMKDSAFLEKPICPRYIYDAEAKTFTPRHTNIYRVGTEYASGGAGAVSTVDDYIAFLEALRTGKLLKPETVRLLATDRLTDYQKRTYPSIKTRGYGLGVRTPNGIHPHTEFGWGGAAGAFWSIDMTHNLSIYYAQHVTRSPNNDLRSQIYSLVFDELTGSQTATLARDHLLNKLTY